jgi:exosome complex RNA-binding protein Rrp42 (RNase PH superfamily)
VTAPSSQQEELQRILMDALDLSCLGIVEGQAAWRLQVTLQVLQDDGNVWDASFLAAIAALQDARLPATQRNAKAGTMEILEEEGEEGSPLMFHYTPVPLTVGIYCNTEEAKTHLLADPTPQEESLLQGYMTMVVSDDEEIVHIQHSSKVGLGREELAVCAHMAYGRGKEIRNLLKVE